LSRLELLSLQFPQEVLRYPAHSVWAQRSATVEINGVITTIPPALGPDETAILTALENPVRRH
jgi:hypothetical protein